MTEIKARLQGGVQEKKKTGAERLKTILEEIKKKGTISETELVTATGLEKEVLGKYVEYLKENGLVTVNKKLFREAEITAIGGRALKTPPKTEEQKAETKAEPKPKELEPTVTEEPPMLAQTASDDKKIEPTAESPPTPPVEEPSQPQPTSEKTDQSAQIQPQNDAEIGTQNPPEAQAQHAQIAAPSMGDKLLPSTEAELKEVAESLITDFIGVVRLFGEIQDQSYTAGLLIDKGDVVAATFEHMDTAEIIFADEAIKELQEKFAGTKGELEIYELSEEDLNESIRKNINSTLSSQIKLSSLKIRIKSNAARIEEQPKKSVLSGFTNFFSTSDTKAKEERITALKEQQKKKVERLQGGLNLIDFARNLKFDPAKAKRFEELRKTIQPPDQQDQEGIQDSRKTARLEELKAQRAQFGLKNILPAGAGPGLKDERFDKLKQAKKITPLQVEKEDKTPVKTVKEGKKVETNIDKFYEYVKSQGKVRLNDSLANKLKVNKTQLEAWAMILEEHSLLELRYPTIGEPEISYSQSEKSAKKDDADGHKKR